MKPLPGLLILLAILPGTQKVASSTAPSTDAKRQNSVSAKKRGNLADLPVRAIEIKTSNVHLALLSIAGSYKVPIGLEVSPNDDLLKDRSIVVQLENGTLKDVLNSIVRQNPLYTWHIEDDVINVFPKGNRDPFLKALLETRLRSFRVPKLTNRFSFRQSLTESAELKGVLASFGVESDNEIFTPYDIAKLGRDFSLNVSGETVKVILNRVIRDSETKYWIVNRHGPERKYLLLNL